MIDDPFVFGLLLFFMFTLGWGAHDAYIHHDYKNSYLCPVCLQREDDDAYWWDRP